MRRRLGLIAAIAILLVQVSFGQANGKLQIHFIDVGQGDSAVLISPKGEVVLFDDGVLKNCDKPVSYLQQLGVAKIDYHIASHYHSDHIGCAAEVFQEVALPQTVIDRGQTYASSVYRNYVTLAGSHRKTAAPGMKIALDSGSTTPVVIEIVALNGNGIATTNENDLSVVSVVTFGGFRAELGGDLSGFKTENYEDIETSVAPKVGQIQVYKVHHHCSRYSTNAGWLAAVKPKVGIISTGDGNTYGHPTEECLERLHTAGVRTYWTEKGTGGEPDPAYDVVAGTVVVEVAPEATSFTVRHGAAPPDKYAFSGKGSEDDPAAPMYVWSAKSKVYHFANCRYAQTISPENLQKSDTPPPGKKRHEGCPK